MAVMTSAQTPALTSIAVYCGSAPGEDPAFARAARDLGAELARRRLRLVYGGGNVGLMGIVADSVLAAGGEVVGVIPHQLANLEMAHPGLTSLEKVDTMAQRKTRMEELADGFIALPGGIGTLEELAEVLTLQSLGTINGPVGLLNPAGFWEPFLEMYRGFAAAGFVQSRYVNGLLVDSEPGRLLDKFAGWTPLGAKWDNN